MTQTAAASHISIIVSLFISCRKDKHFLSYHHFFVYYPANFFPFVLCTACFVIVSPPFVKSSLSSCGWKYIMCIFVAKYIYQAYETTITIFVRFDGTGVRCPC